jgi:hypothetical protein
LSNSQQGDKVKAREELEWFDTLQSAARNARDIAAEMSCPDCRDILLAIADDYDRISKRSPGTCTLSVDGHPDKDSPRNDEGGP